MFVKRWFVGVIAVICVAAGVLRAEDAPASAAAATARPLVVGFVISQATETQTKDAKGQPFAMLNLKRVLDSVAKAGFTMVPVIEPDTQEAAETKGILQLYFTKDGVTEPPLLVNDAKALGSLDVLVIVDYWVVKNDALDAIETAAKNGTKLLVLSEVGLQNPGTNDQTRRITGMDKGRFTYNRIPIECKVTQAHPLLGTLKEGDAVVLAPNGPGGVVRKDVTPLLKAVDQDNAGIHGGRADGAEFCPLYISSLGKGKIVEVAWSPFRAVPQAVNAATKGRFYERAILWLCDRPLGDDVTP